jgi:glutathione S-transferase
MSAESDFVVYGNPMSTCTQLLLATSGEREFPIKLVTIDFSKGEHKGAAHLARQPFGKVPAAEYKGVSVYESKAIATWIHFLSSKPNDDFFPDGKTNPTGAAKVGQWLSVGASYIVPEVAKICFQRVWGNWSGNKFDEAATKAAHTAVTPAFDVLEKQLAQTKFLTGDHFTLADLAIVPYLNVLSGTPEKDLIESRPNVARWWAAVSSRPAWQKAIGK